MVAANHVNSAAKKMREMLQPRSWAEVRDDCELPIKKRVSSQDDGQEILVRLFSNSFLNVSSRQFKRRAAQFINE
jgi:hypothetical protein